MSTIVQTLIGLLIPFLGTSLGAACVFGMKRQFNPTVQKAMLGFASGIMIAASVWSLLMPAMELAEDAGTIPWIPAAVGFFCGVGFLLVLDRTIPHLHIDSDTPEGMPSVLKKTSLLALAVTIHNIPEGMAVGMTFAGMLSGETHITFAGALALAIGIAIQNVPEGAIISMPLRAEGSSRRKAFGLGVLSGAVEPLGALVTIALSWLVLPLLPYLLSFAAGAMIYVVVEELIPETQEGAHSNAGVLGCSAGFVLMMILDVALG